MQPSPEGQVSPEDAAPVSGAGGGSAPVEGGAEGGGESRPQSDSPFGADAEPAAPPNSGEGDTEGEDEAEDQHTFRTSTSGDSGQNSQHDGLRAGKLGRSRFAKHEFIRIIKECEGNISMAARIMDITPASVRERMAKIPALVALYGERTNGSELPMPPTDAAAMLRDPAMLPAPVSGADLGQMVEVTEKLLKGGLAKLGVPKATIDKLRDLSELHIDPGAMLAVSLTQTHQLYHLQLLTLQARADQIYNQYLNTESDQYVKEMDDMVRMFWQRAHTEIVEQLGKGHDRMMAGTVAMVQMMNPAKGKPEKPADSGDAGWQQQVPKSVSRARDQSR